MTSATTDTARALSHILDAMIDAHETLHSVVVEHRAALSRADRQAVADAMREEAKLIDRIRTLDQDRREAFGHATAVQDIAREFNEPVRASVLERASKLRACIEAVRKEQAVVESASRALLGHMEGLFRQVAARLSHAGTYGRMGRVEAGHQVVTGIDLTR